MVDRIPPGSRAVEGAGLELPEREARARRPAEERRTFRLAASSGAVEAIGGLLTVILAVAGLAELLPFTLAAVATIALGAALCAKGVVLASRYAAVAALLEPRDPGARTELGGGLGVEILGGAASVVLGILALVGVSPTVLVPAAVIVLGGTLLFATSATYRLGTVTDPGRVADPRDLETTRDALQASAGGEILIGLAGVVLGILALALGEVWLTLSLVGLLTLGVAVLVGGGTLSAMFLGVIRR